MCHMLCVGTLWGQRRASGSLELEPPSVEILCENNKHSEPLSHFPVPSLCSYLCFSSPSLVPFLSQMDSLLFSCHIYLNLDFAWWEKCSFVFSNFDDLLFLPFPLRPPLIVPPPAKLEFLKVYFSVETKVKPAAPNLSYMLSYVLLYMS